MTRALVFLAIAFSLGACGREPAIASPARPLDVPPIDAGPPPASPQPRATGEVTSSLLNRDGGHWGPYLTMKPDAADAMKACYTQALATDPTITGWAMFDVAAYGSGLALADSSALPRPLLVCLENALKLLRLVEEGSMLPTSLVYVTLR